MDNDLKRKDDVLTPSITSSLCHANLLSIVSSVAIRQHPLRYLISNPNDVASSDSITTNGNVDGR